MRLSLIELSAAVHSRTVCGGKGLLCCLNGSRTSSSAVLALQDTGALAAAEYGRRVGVFPSIVSAGRRLYHSWAVHQCWGYTSTVDSFSFLILGSLITGLSFLSRFAEISRKREPNAAGPTVMFHEVATLVHLMGSSKPEARAEGIRLIVLLEVPLLLGGRPFLASVAIDNLSRVKAVHDKKIAGDFGLISPCR